MKLRNKLITGLALGAMLASGSAAAALNGHEVYEALTSLRLALVKIGVANAMLSDPTPPSSNAEARVAAATSLVTPDISAILVSKGGVINVYLKPTVGITNGIIQLVPKVVTDKQGNRSVQYTCFSPNIADIASAASQCTYHVPQP